MNIKDIETVQRVIRDSSKLQLHDLADLMKDAPEEYIEYMKSLCEPASKRQRGIAKRRRANTAKQSKPTPDRSNNFGLWLREMEKNVRNYLDRVKAGTLGLNLLETKSKAPWELEIELDSDLPYQLSQLEGQPAKLKELFSKYFSMFTEGTRAIVDLQLRTFAQELDCGAILTCLVKHLVTTKLMTHDELSKATGFSKSKSERMRYAFGLVREYNLLLYSGTSYGELYKWRKELIAHLNDNPDEAHWWQGGNLSYGNNLPAKSFDPERNLAFDKHIYGYSRQNLQGREANLKKIQAAVGKPGKRQRSEDEYDSDSEESIEDKGMPYISVPKAIGWMEISTN